MALDPKIELTALDDDAKSFLLKDITGDYSVNNLGGYGAPNPARGDIVDLIIELFNEGNETAILKYDPANITDFINGVTAQLVTPVKFGESSSSYFVDGVIWVNYHTLLAPITIVTVSGGLSITSAALFTGSEEVVAMAGVPYRVDKSKANTSSLLHLLDVLPAGTVSVNIGYTATSTLLNVKGLESDLAKAIAKKAGSCGCSDADIIHHCKILANKIGAEVRYACKDYVGAQQIITTNKNNLEKGCSSC